MKNKRAVLPTVGLVCTAIFVRALIGDTGNPFENILVAMFVGGLVGLAIGLLQYFFTAEKFKGTKLKKDSIVFGALILLSLPFSDYANGILTIALVAIFVLKVAYFNHEHFGRSNGETSQPPMKSTEDDNAERLKQEAKVEIEVERLQRQREIERTLRQKRAG